VKRIFFAFFFGALTAIFLLAPQRPAFALSARDQAAAAWERRAETGQLEQAIQFWQQALQSDPGQADIYIWLTKACGSALRHAKDAKEKRRWADAALQYGEKAIQANPQSSEAYAQYGEALGQYAHAHEGIRSLNNVKEAVAALHRAVELKPSNAYAHMLLSEFYAHAPATISVGDKKKALEEAKLAVSYDATRTINYLALADAYKANDNREPAIEALKHVLSMPAPADAIPETKSDQEKARSILKQYHLVASDAGSDCANPSPAGACMASPDAPAGSTAPAGNGMTPAHGNSGE
jgi:tetratricopeptide (TPR) repeat protein